MALMREPFWTSAVVSGRARRLDYWSLRLLPAAVPAGLCASFGATIDGSVLAAEEPEPVMAGAKAAMAGTSGAAAGAIALFGPAAFRPSRAVAIRRRRDSDERGWWRRVGLVPAGPLLLRISRLLPGTRGPNRSGEDPRRLPAAAFGALPG